METFNTLDEAERTYISLIQLITVLNPYSVKNDDMTRDVIDSTFDALKLDLEKEIIFDAIRRGMTYKQLSQRLEKYVKK